jgi:hypothetical protein
MLSFSRVLCTIALGLAVTIAVSAEPTKDSPFGQAGTTPPPPVAALDAIDFAGVSTVGNRTMINLYDKQQKRSFWVEAGKPTGDLTVTNYDSAHDQITLKTRSGEKVLPLRPPSAVVNGTAPTAAPVATPALSAPAPTGGAATPTQSLSQARQEEEARMLVSDLLEIGMAQRKAYEEAQRRTAAGLPPHAAPAAPAPDANPTAAAGAQPAQPATAATPSS